MNDTYKQFNRYVWSLIVVFGITLLLTVIINFTVDPYGLFDTPRIKGFNQLKPKATSHVRISKSYQVDKVQPLTIIAGNSRPEMGLDPVNNCWPKTLNPVYNLSLPGASMYMVLRYVQHAVSGSEIERVYLGLDFIDFLKGVDKTENLFQWPPVAEVFEDRLRVTVDGLNNDKYFWTRIKDHLTSLLSLDTLLDSLYTMYSQSDLNAPTIRRNGFNPANDYLDIMELEGQGLIFKQKNLSMLKRFNKYNSVSSMNIKKNSKHFESLRQLLAFSNKNKVEVVLFINPYHSDYLAAIKLSGLWKPFLAWKEHLTYMTEEYDVPLWDFSGFNELSITQPSPIGDKEALLPWFWEPAHYRSQYGDLMLAQMLNTTCNKVSPSARGVLLTKMNIVKHLRGADMDLLQYESDYSMAIKRLQKLKFKSQ